MDVGIHFTNCTLPDAPEGIRGHVAPAEILNTTMARISHDVDVDELVADMGRYAALGMDHVQIVPLGPDPAAVVKLVGKEILPRLAERSSAR